MVTSYSKAEVLLGYRNQHQRVNKEWIQSVVSQTVPLLQQTHVLELFQLDRERIWDSSVYLFQLPDEHGPPETILCAVLDQLQSIRPNDVRILQSILQPVNTRPPPRLSSSSATGFNYDVSGTGAPVSVGVGVIGTLSIAALSIVLYRTAVNYTQAPGSEVCDIQFSSEMSALETGEGLCKVMDCAALTYAILTANARTNTTTTGYTDVTLCLPDPLSPSETFDSRRTESCYKFVRATMENTTTTSQLHTLITAQLEQMPVQWTGSISLTLNPKFHPKSSPVPDVVLTHQDEIKRIKAAITTKRSWGISSLSIPAGYTTPKAVCDLIQKAVHHTTRTLTQADLADAMYHVLKTVNEVAGDVPLAVNYLNGQATWQVPQLATLVQKLTQTLETARPGTPEQAIRGLFQLNLSRTMYQVYTSGVDMNVHMYQLLEQEIARYTMAEWSSENGLHDDLQKACKTLDRVVPVASRSTSVACYAMISSMLTVMDEAEFAHTRLPSRNFKCRVPPDLHDFLTTEGVITECLAQFLETRSMTDTIMKLVHPHAPVLARGIADAYGAFRNGYSVINRPLALPEFVTSIFGISSVTRTGSQSVDWALHALYANTVTVPYTKYQDILRNSVKRAGVTTTQMEHTYTTALKQVAYDRTLLEQSETWLLGTGAQSIRTLKKMAEHVGMFVERVDEILRELTAPTGTESKVPVDLAYLLFANSDCNWPSQFTDIRPMGRAAMEHLKTGVLREVSESQVTPLLLLLQTQSRILINACNRSFFSGTPDVVSSMDNLRNMDAEMNGSLYTNAVYLRRALMAMKASHYKLYIGSTHGDYFRSTLLELTHVALSLCKHLNITGEVSSFSVRMPESFEDTESTPDLHTGAGGAFLLDPDDTEATSTPIPVRIQRYVKRCANAIPYDIDCVTRSAKLSRTVLREIATTANFAKTFPLGTDNDRKRFVRDILPEILASSSLSMYPDYSDTDKVVVWLYRLSDAGKYMWKSFLLQIGPMTAVCMCAGSIVIMMIHDFSHVRQTLRVSTGTRIAHLTNDFLRHEEETRQTNVITHNYHNGLYLFREYWNYTTIVKSTGLPDAVVKMCNNYPTVFKVPREMSTWTALDWMNYVMNHRQSWWSTVQVGDQIRACLTSLRVLFGGSKPLPLDYLDLSDLIRNDPWKDILSPIPAVVRSWYAYPWHAYLSRYIYVDESVLGPLFEDYQTAWSLSQSAETADVQVDVTQESEDNNVKTMGVTPLVITGLQAYVMLLLHSRVNAGIDTPKVSCRFEYGGHPFFTVVPHPLPTPGNSIDVTVDCDCPVCYPAKSKSNDDPDTIHLAWYNFMNHLSTKVSKGNTQIDIPEITSVSTRTRRVWPGQKDTQADQMTSGITEFTDNLRFVYPGTTGPDVQWPRIVKGWYYTVSTNVLWTQLVGNDTFPAGILDDWFPGIARYLHAFSGNILTLSTSIPDLFVVTTSTDKSVHSWFEKQLHGGAFLSCVYCADDTTFPEKMADFSLRAQTYVWKRYTPHTTHPNIPQAVFLRMMHYVDALVAGLLVGLRAQRKALLDLRFLLCVENDATSDVSTLRFDRFLGLLREHMASIPPGSSSVAVNVPASSGAMKGWTFEDTGGIGHRQRQMTMLRIEAAVYQWSGIRPEQRHVIMETVRRLFAGMDWVYTLELRYDPEAKGRIDLLYAFLKQKETETEPDTHQTGPPDQTGTYTNGNNQRQAQTTPSKTLQEGWASLPATKTLQNYIHYGKQRANAGTVLRTTFNDAVDRMTNQLDDQTDVSKRNRFSNDTDYLLNSMGVATPLKVSQHVRLVYTPSE